MLRLGHLLARRGSDTQSTGQQPSSTSSFGGCGVTGKAHRWDGEQQLVQTMAFAYHTGASPSARGTFSFGAPISMHHELFFRYSCSRVATTHPAHPHQHDSLLHQEHKLNIYVEKKKRTSEVPASGLLHSCSRLQ